MSALDIDAVLIEEKPLHVPALNEVAEGIQFRAIYITKSIFRFVSNSFSVVGRTQGEFR